MPLSSRGPGRSSGGAVARLPAAPHYCCRSFSLLGFCLPPPQSHRYAYSGPLSALLLGLCLWLLLLIALTDAKTALIPDALNIPFLVFSLLHGYINGLDLITPAVIGSGFFAAQWVISRGRWVGTGDIVLAAGIGAFLGSVPLLLLALWIAYVSGAIVAVILLIHKKKTMQSRLAFGPFLVGGACVAFVWGEQIVRLVGL